MKNRVTVNNIVIKEFHSRIAAEKEYKLLTILKDSNMAPDIIKYDSNTLETTNIPGCTLSEILEQAKELKSVFEKLVDYLIQFNDITQNIVLDDINLKNFIFHDDRIYGIDFENWHYGDNQFNLAAVAAVIHTAYFDESLKAELYCHIKKYIVSGTGCDEKQLEKQAAALIDKTALRRRAMKRIRQSDCVIIAGGKSSRMGSPKGLLEYKGYTFIDHIIYNTSVFDRQYISANNDLYNKFRCELIKDKIKDTGPMGAVFSALESCDSEYVFFIPCDMPLITEETIFHLFDKMDSEADAVVYTAEDRVFPTVAIYRKTVLPQIAKLLEAGNYRMMVLLDKIKTQYISAPLPHQFKNINTPDDYKNIK